MQRKTKASAAPVQEPLHIRPITFRAASEFVARLHRHNKPPRGCKFCIAVHDPRGALRGVAQCGRPVARSFDDGRTLEINRTCTDGAPNANSCLYGAARTIAKGMGYTRVITYTQMEESGASLKGAGFVRVKDLDARKSWSESTKKKKLKVMRDPIGNGGVARVLWEVRFTEVK